MSFASTLNKLLRRDSETRQAAATQYRQLVIDAASDRPVSQTQIEDTLAAAGRTLEQLQADVAIEQERRRNLDVAGCRDELLAELSRISQAERSEAEEFQAQYADVVGRHQAAGAQFRARRAVLNAELDRCRLAERSLTAGHPRLAAIRTELADIRQEESQLRMMTGRPKTPTERYEERVNLLGESLDAGRMTQEMFDHEMDRLRCPDPICCVPKLADYRDAFAQLLKALSAGRLDQETFDRDVRGLNENFRLSHLDRQLATCDARRQILMDEQAAIEAELLTTN